MADTASRYKKSLAKGKALWDEMQANVYRWSLIGRFVYPWRNSAIAPDKAGDATRSSREIIDGSASLALTSFRAGMLAGNASPSDEWVKISAYSQNAALNRAIQESTEAKEFFEQLEIQFYSDVNNSNFYRAAPLAWGDQGLYGTSAMQVMADDDDPFRCYVFPIGSYAFAVDDRGVPNTFYREFQMTAAQMKSKFGEANLSEEARRACGEGQTGQDLFNICCLIQPNENGASGYASESSARAYIECYYESGAANSGGGTAGSHYATLAGGSEKDQKFLSERGYDIFPVVITRWLPAGGSTPWGVGPGQEILGDVMQLQAMTRDALNAIEFETNPAVQGPSSLQEAYIKRRPGKFTAVDVTQGQQGITKLFEPNLRLDHVELMSSKCIARINEGLYKDLFKQFTGAPDRLPKTAYLAQRMFQEKAGNLLPAMQQQYDEFLSPFIDLVIHIRAERGDLPPIPKLLQNAPLRYEYTSPFARAQRAQRSGDIETFLGVIGQMAAVWPHAAAYVDVAPAVDAIADSYSISPKLIRDKDEVAAEMEAQAQAMEQQRVAENVPGATRAVQNLSQTPVDGGQSTALDALVGAGQ